MDAINGICAGLIIAGICWWIVIILGVICKYTIVPVWRFFYKKIDKDIIYEKGYHPYHKNDRLKFKELSFDEQYFSDIICKPEYTDKGKQDLAFAMLENLRKIDEAMKKRPELWDTKKYKRKKNV